MTRCAVHWCATAGECDLRRSERQPGLDRRDRVGRLAGLLAADDIDPPGQVFACVRATRRSAAVLAG